MALATTGPFPEGDDPLNQSDDSDVELLQSATKVALVPRRRRCQKSAMIAAGSAMVLVAVIAAIRVAPHRYVRSPSADSARTPELAEVVVVPPRERCSKDQDNCLSTRCCQKSGYQCYEMHSGYAKCLKECIPGVDSTCLSPNNHLTVTKEASRSSVSQSATNLFCFTFYMQDTGSTKKSYQLELLRTNLFLGTSIFGCEASRVYSDVATWLSPGQVNTVQVFDVAGDFHFEKRKKKGTWVNSGMFIQVWKEVQKDGVWSTKDWTVKVDPETVFLPERLRTKLEVQAVTGAGVYFENCPFVAYGFFGGLEVISQKAVGTYLSNLDECKATLNWKGHEKLYGYQAWGEDLFAQRCMDLHGVDKVDGFDLMVDGNCEAFRPHDEKKNRKWKPHCASAKTPALHRFPRPDEYFQCLKEAQGS